MRKAICFTWLAPAFLSMTNGFGQVPVDIPVPNLMQETQVWCWAAVAQQVIVHSRGPANTPAQCALVAMANGAPPGACCDFVNPACVRTGALQQIQYLIAQFGGRYSSIAAPTDPLTLYGTLAKGHPIILQIGSGMGVSHVVVLRGMAWDPMAGPVLFINDPMAFYTQPLPYHQLLPLWRSAIVVL